MEDRKNQINQISIKELSPQKPLKWSCDLQGWSVEEQYINRARSESRLTTMTSFETNLKKD